VDDAIKLQNAERAACECSAYGSGEEHEPWCKARRFDLTPEGLTATEALAFLKIR
jgi:hypothetical protein